MRDRRYTCYWYILALHTPTTGRKRGPGCLEVVITRSIIVMDRVAPKDIQGIVSGVGSNRQLMAGVVEQLKEVLQPPPPATATGGNIPWT